MHMQLTYKHKTENFNNIENTKNDKHTNNMEYKYTKT